MFLEYIKYSLLTDLGFKTNSHTRMVYVYLLEILQSHSFYETVTTPSKSYIQYGDNPLEHPIGSKDKGHFIIDCKTDVSGLDNEELARLLINVNDYSTNAFIQQIRRSLNILERPLVTARGEGKSYIYANNNPKYAHYALTSLRTYYNFCKPIKYSGNEELTPAQRIELTEKVFELEDIIYLR